MENPKHEMFTTKILAALAETLFNEDSELRLEEDDLQTSDDIKHFFYALGAVVPAVIFDDMVESDEGQNALEMNQLVNKLCFQFMNKIEEPNKE